MSGGASKFCNHCGHDLAAAAQYCTDCGHAVSVGVPELTKPLVPFPGQGRQGCERCGRDGSELPPAQLYCHSCRWLRPLAPGYDVDVGAYMWRFDAEGMSRLRSLGPISAAAQNIAEHYGRPIFEAAVNGIRLSERQMPEIFGLAVHAARLLGLKRMPEVYLSGERMWDIYTLGGDCGSFIAVGSVMMNFKKPDLLFLLLREMAHIRVGHVHWMTALEFLFGNKRGKSTIMGDGMFQFLNPAKIVESAIDAPLMAWARHSEITADRAALLATGSMDVARRTLSIVTLKSFPAYGRIQEDAWMAQEFYSQDASLKMSEWTMSTTPYLAPRLKTLRDFSTTPEFGQWREYIQYWVGSERSKRAPVPAPPSAPPAPPSPPAGSSVARVRVECPACKESLSTSAALLCQGKPIRVKCPQVGCAKLIVVRPRAREGGSKAVRLDCTACGKAMSVPADRLKRAEPVLVRCPHPGCREVLHIRPPRPDPNLMDGD